MCANTAGYIGVVHMLGDDYTMLLSYQIRDSASDLKKLGGRADAILPPNAGCVSREEKLSLLPAGLFLRYNGGSEFNKVLGV